jgi:diguanylate cyclase (GGDEF)-like protein/PAS domain S-box-containing protein
LDAATACLTSRCGFYRKPCIHACIFVCGTQRDRYILMLRLREQGMEHNQTRLSRLQLFGTLLIVIVVAMSMSGYFLVLHWRDFSNRQHAVAVQSNARARERLRAFSDQTVLMLGSLRERASTTLKQRVQEQTDQAYGIARSIWQREHARRPRAEVERMIVDTLRPLRYHNGQSYYFITSLSGQAVLQPINPEEEGHDTLNLRDDTGRYVVRNLIAAANNPDGRGFSYYRWGMPGSQQMMDKIAYVRRFPELNWMIGTGEYVPFADQELQQQGLALLAQLQQSARGNFIILDPGGVLLMYPPDPTMVGKHYLSLAPNMRAALVALLSRGNESGFLEYPLQGQHTLSYVRKLPGWDWLLATSVPMQQLVDSNRNAEKELHDALYQRIRATLLMTLAALCAAGLFSWIFMRWMNALIARYRDDLWASHHELKQRSRELLLSRFMMDNASEIVCLMDQHARLAYQNDMASSCLGASGHQHDLAVAALFQTQELPLPQTYQVSLPEDDQQRTFEVTQNGIEYEGEHYRSITARDITRRVRADKELRLAARVFETSTEAILIADSQNRILTVNQSFLDTTGYSEQEVLGHTPSLLASGRHSRNFYDEMWKLLREHGQWSGEIWNRRKNGDIYPEWLNISVLADDQGKVSHYVAMFNEITPNQRNEVLGHHQQEVDLLTDLPSRSQINERLLQEIHQAEESHGELAVLFIDLDNFKSVNDTLGHNLGDALLKDVARRLAQTLREVDTVGRTGGDEFVLILPQLQNHDEAAQVAERVLQSLQQPFTLSGHTLKISSSIGISLYPKDGHDIQGLMMSADLAMYHAKASGRNTFRFYSSQMNTQFNERLMLESRLRDALDNDQLALMYQPLFAIDGRTLLGCEALLRWHHEELGFVAPERFIPVAEETGLIDRIGALVLDLVCRQIAHWQQQGITVLPVAVNVTATQLARPHLVDDIRAALAKYQLSGDVLELEMNEDALMANPAHAMSVLDRIRACGVRLAIDDFGLGYSSPAHLKRFAPEAIKINRSYIAGLPDDSEHAAIVSSIIHLADAMKIPTVAEGVETETQRLYLARMGCKGFQGFLAGAPQSGEGMGQLLTKRRAGGSPAE